MVRRHRRTSQVGDQRNPFVRDYDRILYSREFRRLSGVTQVVRAGEPFVYHDRLSHSLKVAQVARTLATLLQDRLDERRLNTDYWIDEHVVQAAALAHDLGHPPFGHAAESKLDDLVDDDYGGFEGNAQSFRIVTTLAQQRRDYPGLNLTRATLDALLKYPYGFDEGPRDDKWGYYPTEQDEFEWVRRHSNRHHERSIEAEIMDYADDLTYAIHDVDDFYRTGLVPLHRLLSETDATERNRFAEHVAEETDVGERYVNRFFVDRLRSMTDPALDAPFDGSDGSIAATNKFVSALIERYLGVNHPETIRLGVDSGELVMERPEEFEKDLTILKRLTRFYVITDAKLVAQQHGQREIVERLFEFFLEQTPSDAELANIVPSPYRERLDALPTSDEGKRVRIVADAVASLTEQQAVQLYRRLSGDAPGSVKEGIVR